MTPLLSGIRVVDLTSVIMGPFATFQLGALGADVIKVEPPTGEAVRHIGPMKSPLMGAMFLNANRNKRSICLDLKEENGRDALHRIVATADVVVHNMRRRAAVQARHRRGDAAGAEPAARPLHRGRLRPRRPLRGRRRL